MKFPTLKNVLSEGITTLKRFPLAIFFAFLGTITAMYLVETKSEDELLIRLVMTCGLGLLLGISAVVYAEKTEKNKTLWQLIALVISVLLFFVLNPFDNKVDAIRYFSISVALHLLVSFAPFIAKGQINGFWQYNKVLFIRILTAGLYSAVLFLGIAAAIGTTDLLFNININSTIYFHVWVFLAGIFNTLFFLSCIPSNWEELNKDTNYPKGLKAFTQFVLIPLVSIYLVILIAYEFKILLEWELPKGIISSLILPYSVFGILSILLVFPIKNLDENKWITTFSKWFYVALFPLIIMLYIAIGKRMYDYGITESRYYLLLLTLWLTFIAFYFVFKSKDNIKIIPISLCIAALISIYGPQSANSVSNWSQLNRFETIAKNANAITESKIKSDFIWTVDDGRHIASIVNYFYDKNQLNKLSQFTETDLNRIQSNKNSLDINNENYYETSQLTKDSTLSVFGVNSSVYLYNFNIDDEVAIETARWHRITNDNINPTISGYNSVLLLNATITDNKYKSEDIILHIDSDYQLLIKKSNDTFTFDLNKLSNYITTNYDSITNSYSDKINLPQDYLIIDGNNNARLIIGNFNFYYDKELASVDINLINGIILLK